jgi:hypothetical protein
MAVATAVAAKGAEALVAGGTSAVRRLVRLVRDRFGSGTREDRVLQATMADPDDREKVAALVAVLARVLAADPTFRRDVSACWGDVSEELRADRGAVVNQFNGSATKVVQARDIHGDVTL